MPETLAVQPYDVHNQLLVSNVHPADWDNPEPVGRYNLVVLGAGTAGLISAAGAAGLGGGVRPEARLTVSWLSHPIVELDHERGLTGAGVVPEWLCPLHQDFL